MLCRPWFFLMFETTEPSNKLHSGSSPLSFCSPSRRRADCACQCAGKPKNDQDDEHQPKNAAESCPAIAAMSVIAATAAQQNDNKNDQQNRHHDRFPSSFN